MPSIIVGGLSGGMILISGNVWSGQGSFHPVGGIQMRLDPAASGNVYVALSGNMTVTSGGQFKSGGGLADGMLMAPGDAYFVPKMAFQTSGLTNVYLGCDAAASGQARLYWEAF